MKRDQKQENGDGKSEQKDNADLASEGTDIVIVIDEKLIGFTGHESSWVIDSGASFHVTSKRDFFSSYTQGNFGHVRMGNDNNCKIVGMGEVHIETNTGYKLVLKKVMHVPHIRLNLISTGQLDDDGYQSHFGGGKCKIFKGSLVVAKGIKSTTLYTTDVKMSTGNINIFDNEAQTELWHKRLGHMSEKGMQILARKKLLPEVKGTVLKPCEHCLAGKQHRVSFKGSSHRTNNVLDLVHSDVCA